MMKKTIFTLLGTAMWAVAAMATTYSGTLTLGGTQQSGVTVTVQQNSDGTYDLSCPTLSSLTMTRVAASEQGGTTVIASSNSTLRGVARFDGQGHLFISFSTGGQSGTFDAVGDYFQLPNAGFEQFASNGEPLRWHGFASASGGLASMAPGKLGSSSDVRPGSTGTHSAVATAGAVFGIVGNGTMTTGRLNAGAFSATDPNNHSEMDMSSTATDANGDPFYLPVHSRPDAVKVWLKFKQGKANARHPYATFSGIITDGTYYQDPEDKTYSNVAAKAQNQRIAECDWTEFTIPFNYAAYAANNAASRGLLITISTNADAGQGSNGDQIFADDIELVYDAAIGSVAFQGQALTFANGVCTLDYSGNEAPAASDFAVTTTGEAATTHVTVEQLASGYRVNIVAVSGDLKTADTRTVILNVPQTVTGDVNGDGAVNANDVSTLSNMVLGNLESNPAADMNGDGTVNANDVSLLVTLVLGNANPE